MCCEETEARRTLTSCAKGQAFVQALNSVRMSSNELKNGQLVIFNFFLKNGQKNGQEKHETGRCSGNTLKLSGPNSWIIHRRRTIRKSQLSSKLRDIMFSFSLLKLVLLFFHTLKPKTEK